MSETSRIEEWTAKAGRNPIRAMAGSALVTVAIAQGIPQVVALWAERGEAIDARVDEAYKSHLMTLDSALNGCESAKQRLAVRLRECVEACSR